MAYVSAPGSDGSRPKPGDRAQLILVAALTIAVILVALVLLLNTVIYTENLATRGVDAGGNDVIEYRATVIFGVGELIDEENRVADGFNATTVRNGINATDDALSYRYIQRGIIAEINRTSVEVNGGLLIAQDERQLFESSNESGPDPWNVTSAVEETRQFTITLEPLHNGTDATDGFYVEVSPDVGGGDPWTIYAYMDDDTGNLTVSSEEPGGPEVRCSVDANEAELDLTAGTLNDKPCSAWTWAEGVDSPYTIRFGNSDRANGTYSLTVGDSAEPGSGLNETTEESPYYVGAVYSTSMEIRYESSDLHFITEIRVAPGEPDE